MTAGEAGTPTRDPHVDRDLLTKLRSLYLLVAVPISVAWLPFLPWVARAGHHNFLVGVVGQHRDPLPVSLRWCWR